MLNKIYYLSILFLLPSLTIGQIIFSEIMFNPKGSDAGYEWVEIKNTYNFDLSLEKYKFCEGKPVCHSWAKGKNNNFEIKTNSYGIITDDKDKFLEQNSNFSGLILVSTGFVLTNTGELIQIKNPDGNLDDSLVYNPKSVKKEGDTLSVFDNIWKNSFATPGEDNIYKESGSNNDGDDDDESNINTSYVEISDKVGLKKKLKAEISSQDIFIAGARTKVYGTAYGLSGVEISGIDFFWNFGDGEKDYGQSVFHSYSFPGKYFLSLTVKSGNFTGEIKKKIKVIEPELIISEVKKSENKKTGYIKIKNNSNYLLNLEDWMIMVDGDRFLIPDKTFVDKKSEIIFPNNITTLRIFNEEAEKSKIFLLLPNGEKFYNFYFEKKVEKNKVLEKEKSIFTKTKEKKLNESNNFKNSKKKIEEKKEEESVKNVEYFKEPVLNSGVKQTASILGSFRPNNKYNISSLDSFQNKQTFLKENLIIIILILLFLILTIFSFWLKKNSKILEKVYFKENQENLNYKEKIKKEAEDFEVEEIKY